MENKAFFDPYLLGPNPNLPPNIQLPPILTGSGITPQALSPKDFYEHQYFYYRYLNEYLDYTIKCIEFEKRTNNNSPQKA